MSRSRAQDAVLAGLRMLQAGLDHGLVTPNDGDIGDILTCGGEHPGLTPGEIDTLCETLITSDAMLLPEIPRVVVYLADDAAVSVYTDSPASVRLIDRTKDDGDMRVIPFDDADDYTGLVFDHDHGVDPAFVDRVFALDPSKEN